MLKLNQIKLGIIGLGYVGLPLAAEFGKKRKVIGFDINLERIHQLKSGIDSTLELSKTELKESTKLSFTSEPSDLNQCNCFIVTVPTPINEHKTPNLNPLLSATKTVANILKKGDIVIYESTVYPGATEEECVPILEKESGLVFNQHFFVGYSPERINPGDKAHRLPDILKITSGSSVAAAKIINQLYASIIKAGTYQVASIKIAEAAKVIENTQRDVNISLINELSIIFEKLGIDTEDVLKAAGTKWNFLPFMPGLVGGHCIGVDPYYLTYKAQSIGYQPEIILAGRRLNDSMGEHVVSRLVKAMLKKRMHVKDSRVLIMGATFKENCPDIRNTKVIDIIDELNQFGSKIDVYDPWLNTESRKPFKNASITSKLVKKKYDAVIIAVAHKQFLKMSGKYIRSLCKSNHLVFDLKYVLDKTDSDLRL